MKEKTKISKNVILLIFTMLAIATIIMIFFMDNSKNKHYMISEVDYSTTAPVELLTMFPGLREVKSNRP